MSLRQLLSQPLTVQAVGPVSLNSYGDEIPGALGAPVAVRGYLEQVSTVETLLDRDTVVTKWKGHLPATTIIGHLDYINFQAQRFQVNGAPYHAFNPRTRSVSHIECELVVVDG